jgi:DNA-binding NarL/FixJ family response regulator
MNPRPKTTPNMSPRGTPSARDQKLSVLLVGGRLLVLDLLATALRLRGDLDVIAATTSPAAAISMLARRQPGLVVIDPSLAEAELTGLVDALAAADPSPRVITVFGGEASAEPMPHPSPVHHTIPPQLRRLGERILATFDDAAEAAEVHLEIDRLLESLGQRPASAQPEKLLSRRELEVFSRMGRGLMNACIAAELGISQQTVETHRKSISRKLRTTRAELVRLAVLHVVAHGDETTGPTGTRRQTGV